MTAVSSALRHFFGHARRLPPFAAFTRRSRGRSPRAANGAPLDGALRAPRCRSGTVRCAVYGSRQAGSRQRRGPRGPCSSRCRGCPVDVYASIDGAAAPPVRVGIAGGTRPGAGHPSGCRSPTRPSGHSPPAPPPAGPTQPAAGMASPLPAATMRTGTRSPPFLHQPPGGCCLHSAPFGVPGGPQRGAAPPMGCSAVGVDP